MRHLLTLTLGLGALTLTATAADITIVNPGFEDVSGETQQNEFTFGALPGWSLYDPENITSDGDGPTYYVGTLQPQILGEDEVYQNFPAGAPEGTRVAIAFNFDGSGDDGEYGLQQILSATLQANTRYTLSALIGNIASGQSVASGYFDLDGFPGYRVDLMAGGTVLASDNNSLAGSITEGTFALSSTVYDSPSFGALIGQQLAIRLVNLNQTAGVPEGSDLEVDFDDISLTAVAIPEPASAALLLAGTAALLATTRRHRRPPTAPDKN
ncbi:MAG: PEP-CTERM sorting domain-containing protein [Verrucomicrobiota bacterium]